MPDLTWDEFDIEIDAEYIIDIETWMAEMYWYITDNQEDPDQVWKGDPEGKYEHFVMIGEPDFDSIGHVDPDDVGIYEGYENEDVGLENALPEGTQFAISENGLWVIYYPDDNSVYDCGFLIEDKEFGMWYTVSLDGEPFTIWSWDIYLLTTSGMYGFVAKLDPN